MCRRGHKKRKDVVLVPSSTTFPDEHFRSERKKNEQRSMMQTEQTHAKNSHTVAVLVYHSSPKPIRCSQVELIKCFLTVLESNKTGNNAEIYKHLIE